MSVGMIGAGYLVVGGFAAIAITIAGRLATKIDALLLVILWPLWVPMSLARNEHELVTALERARSSPLASVLPDPETARVLGTRLREASARLAELDVLLAKPDFDAGTVERHAAELGARGAMAAAATARMRVRTIGQLRALRERYRSELDEVHELIAQLVAQAELVRLQPASGAASSELVRELVDRVEGLGELLCEEPHLEYPTPALR